MMHEDKSKECCRVIGMEALYHKDGMSTQIFKIDHQTDPYTETLQKYLQEDIKLTKSSNDYYQTLNNG